MIPKHILSELSTYEINDLDFRAMGNLILNRTISLSQATNNELLKPISQWLDDPNFMEKFAIVIDSDPFNWADYKRQSRQWTKKQRHLTRERLKLYWQAIRQKKKIRQEISKLIGKPSQGQENSFRVSDDFLFPIIKPFSRYEQSRMNLENDFLKVMDFSLSHILPWRVMLTSDIKGEKKFSDLKIYIPEDEKMDKICKLMNLLQLENDGIISLYQKKPFEDFEIQIKSTLHTQISIKDRQGNEWDQNWFDLCCEEKNRMIEKIKLRQIICKQA
jgi:hypothetical protein